MLERINAAIENFQAIMIDTQVNEDFCSHMEFIPEDVDESSDGYITIWGVNGDMFHYKKSRTFASDDDYCVEGQFLEKAVISFV